MVQAFLYPTPTTFNQQATPMGNGKVSIFFFLQKCQFFIFLRKASINFDWKRNHIHLLAQKRGTYSFQRRIPQPLLWVNSKSMGIFEKTFVRK